MEMKQINNGFKENYYLTIEGTIFDSDTNQYIKADNKHGFYLKNTKGERRKINLKPLYKLVYNKTYCIDKIENLEGEEWKVIADTDELYYISNLARIKSLKDYEAKLLTPYKNKEGYLRVDLYCNQRRTCKLVSRLVAAAFLLPPTNIDMQLHHKNGKEDNRACMLQWLTPEEHRKVHAAMRAAAKENDK